jgi:hypothetical protein
MSIAIHTIFKDLTVQCAEGKGTGRGAKEQPHPTHTQEDADPVDNRAGQCLKETIYASVPPSTSIT